jgi:flagellar protein FlaG
MDIRSVGNTTQPAPAFVDKKVADPSAAVHGESQPVIDAAVSAVSEAQSTPPPTLDQVTQAINTINKAMSEMSPDLQFSIDEDSNRTIIKIVDQKTKEVLRQIPSAEALAIAKAIDQAQGLLIKQKA